MPTWLSSLLPQKEQMRNAIHLALYTTTVVRGAIMHDTFKAAHVTDLDEIIQCYLLEFTLSLERQNDLYTVP